MTIYFSILLHPFCLMLLHSFLFYSNLFCYSPIYVLLIYSILLNSILLSSTNLVSSLLYSILLPQIPFYFILLFSRCTLGWLNAMDQLLNDLKTEPNGARDTRIGRQY